MQSCMHVCLQHHWHQPLEDGHNIFQQIVYAPETITPSHGRGRHRPPAQSRDCVLAQEICGRGSICSAARHMHARALQPSRASVSTRSVHLNLLQYAQLQSVLEDFVLDFCQAVARVGAGAAQIPLKMEALKSFHQIAVLPLPHFVLRHPRIHIR